MDIDAPATTRLDEMEPVPEIGQYEDIQRDRHGGGPAADEIFTQESIGADEVRNDEDRGGPEETQVATDDDHQSQFDGMGLV